MVKIRYARNLPDTDPWLNDPDPFVKVTAVSSTGGKYYRQTSNRGGTQNPTWNEWLYTNDREWQFFRVQIWDDDSGLTGDDDVISMSQTVVIQPGFHTIKHCVDTSCNGYLWFDYRMLTLVQARLKVYIRYARNLPDTDPWLNDPDPYVRITALRSSGSTYVKSTSVKGGTEDPTWNDWFDFSECRWASFQIQIWDDDSGLTGADDDMSNLETVIVQPGHHSWQKHCAENSCNGYLWYDYNLILDGNECSPNPCRNGGPCVDGCASYACSCRTGYGGTNCEHLKGNLRFYARYGRNLPDKDG